MGEIEYVMVGGWGGIKWGKFLHGTTKTTPRGTPYRFRNTYGERSYDVAPESQRNHSENRGKAVIGRDWQDCGESGAAD